MKKIGFLIVVMSAAVLAACSSTKPAASSEADQVKARQVAAMLQKKAYKVDFTRAYPMSGPSFSLTYPYYVSVIGDRVESFLPYFGRAYSLPYGGGEGLRFDAPITNYKMEEGRNGKKQVITFDARTAEDNYTFTLEVYPTGESSLTIAAVQKQSMSFSGEMDMEPEFEVVRIAE